MHIVVKKSLLAVAVTSALISNATVAADDPSLSDAEQVYVETIEVKGAKRPKALKDVAASVSVFGNEELKQLNIQKLDDLATFLPNVSISENAISDTVSIRGINSDLQAGGEQSVGIFVDGVFHGRGVQSRFSFLDVESIEVLRGPQGAIFGKNTIGGVISVNTAQPKDSFESNIRVSHEFEQEKTDVSGYITNALNDKGSLTGRFAFNKSESKDGWMLNVANNETMPLNEKNAYRGIVNWQVNDELKINVRVDGGDTLNDGTPYEIYQLDGPLAPLGRAFGAEDKVDGRTNITNNNVQGIGYKGEDKAFLMDTDFSESVVKVDYSIAAGTLTAIAAQTKYDFIRSQDADFGPLPLIQFTDDENFTQNSLELRFVSTDNDDFEYLFGAYLQQSELAVAAVLDAWTGSESILAGLLPVVPQYDITTRHSGLDQDSDTWAVFAQTTFRLADSIKVDLSARYSNEDKQGTQFAFLYGGAGEGVKSGSPIDSPVERAVWSAALLEVNEHSNFLTIEESLFSPAASITWEASDTANFYASVSKGFKGGGFNAIAMSVDPEDAIFQKESALSTEIGSKLTLVDGALDVNLAIFNIDFEDMQTTVFTGGTTYIVRNAAQATSRGLEADMKWYVSNNITLNGSVGYLDFKFDDYKIAACTGAQLLANPQLNAAQCSAAGINDMSGKANQDAPEWKVTMGGQHQATIGNFEITSLLSVTYVDEYFGQPSADPVTIQESVTLVNAAINVKPVDGNWEVSLIGKNLSDENYFWYTNGVPLFTGSYFASYSAPSSLALEFSYTFY